MQRYEAHPTEQVTIQAYTQWSLKQLLELFKKDQIEETFEQNQDNQPED